MKKIEFSGERSRLYKECLKEFPQAREEDIQVMKTYLAPKKNEVVLEVGAGSGFFSKVLVNMVRRLIVSDPSQEQLESVKNLNKENIEFIEVGADELTPAGEFVDAIWSFGAMHHCFEKKKAFKNFFRILNKRGRIVVVDVWRNSALAKHFDEKVDKYCITGHHVEFWTDKMAFDLCFDVGFKKPEIRKLNIKWKFQSKNDIGIFLYKLHAMTKTTPKECLKGAEEILGILKEGKFYCLNWPMKVLVAKK